MNIEELIMAASRSWDLASDLGTNDKFLRGQVEVIAHATGNDGEDGRYLIEMAILAAVAMRAWG